MIRRAAFSFARVVSDSQCQTATHVLLPPRAGRGDARACAGAGCGAQNLHERDPSSPRYARIDLSPRAGADVNNPPRHRRTCPPVQRSATTSAVQTFHQPVACSPDERSDIRVRSASFYATPGFRYAHPGYETFFSARFRQIKERKRNAGRRVVHDLYASGAQGAPRRRRLAPPFRFGRARLPAFHQRHLRQRPNATAQLQFTHFLGRNYGGMGVTHPRPSQCSGRCSPQAGRRAGRAFLTRSRPGAGLTTPPAGTVTRPDQPASPGWRPSGRVSPYVSISGTIVNRMVTLKTSRRLSAF